MFFKLFLLFTLIPVCELYFIIRIGSVIGAFNTVLVILITASVGAYLAKQQGFYVLRRIQDSLSQGKVPGYDLLQGLFVLLGAFALLTPGFITDFIGLSMLIPQVRALYIMALGKYIKGRLVDGHKNGNVHIYRNY